MADEVMTVADLNAWGRVDVGEIDVVLVNIGQKTGRWTRIMTEFRRRSDGESLTRRTQGMNTQQEAASSGPHPGDEEGFRLGMSVTAEIETLPHQRGGGAPQSVTTRLPKEAKEQLDKERLPRRMANPRRGDQHLPRSAASNARNRRAVFGVGEGKR
jgi:hypothetical protein